MQNTAATLFQLEFKQDIFLLLGLIYFGFLVVWLFVLKNSLVVSFLSGGPERLWLIFSLFAGLTFATAATTEWGLPLAGTAFSLGLCMSLALMNSSAAICLLTSSLFLRPWELIAQDSFLGILPRLSMVLCLAHLALSYAIKRKIDFKWTGTAAILLSFTSWAFATTLFASDPAASQGAFFDGLFKCFILYIILLQMVHTRASFRLLLSTVLMSFLSVALISIYQSLRLGSLLEIPDFRLVGFGAFANSNDIASLMVWTLPFAVAETLTVTRSASSRFLATTLGISALIAIILSRSRGAMLGLVTVIALYVFGRMGRKAIVPLIIATVILIVPATFLVFQRRTEDLANSSAGRKTYLKAAIRMGIKNPVFGVGYDAYPVNLGAYSTESLEESEQMTAHNSWVLVFAELGVIGLLLFTSAFLYSGNYAWKLYGSSPELLLALAGYGVTILFLSHSYLIYPYLLFAWIDIASTLDVNKKRCA